MSDIEERVKKIVAKNLDVENSRITPEASFVEDFGADSLDQVELVMAFEEEFDVQIPDDVAEKIKIALRFSDEKAKSNNRERIFELGLDSVTIAKKIVGVYKNVLEKR